jgi:hypothetical protein
MTGAQAFDLLVRQNPVKAAAQDELRARVEVLRPVLPALSPNAHARPRLSRARLLVSLAVLLVGALLVAPAFGLHVPGLNFFDGEPAPQRIVEDFAALDKGAPGVLAPHALPASARLAHRFTLLDGSTADLWIAPTVNGGYCTFIAGYNEGCRQRSDQSVSFATGQRSASDFAISGDVPSESGTREVEVTLSNGDTESVPLVWISAPIDAGFYLYEIPAALAQSGVRVNEVRSLDSNGHTLSSQVIPPEQFPGQPLGKSPPGNRR